MGTSSARRAPTGTLWRRAKTQASRFASGAEAAPPRAAEVIAAYSLALESLTAEAQGLGEPLLPDVVRTAAALEQFFHHWEAEGWTAALSHLGLERELSRDDLIPALADRLAGPGATLDQAVTRLALLAHLDGLLPSGVDSGSGGGPDLLEPPDSLAAVGTFLGLAMHQKVLSDLGEPLEFHAPSVTLAQQRQEELQRCILLAVQTLTASPTAGLAGAENRVHILWQRLIDHLQGHPDA